MSKVTSLASRMLFVGAVCLASALPATAGETQPVETKEQRDARMGWWRDARFGMFIHWGLYAVPAGEWKGQKIQGLGEWIMTDAAIPVEEYQALQQRFNPVKFDAKRWARLAKGAGMKYVVLTTKHIDGFCMFDSKLTDYDIMGTPFRRDVMKELAEAVRGAGMKMCAYYSISDFHHPDYTPLGPGSSWPNVAAHTKPADFARYLDYLHGQLRELLTSYGPLGVIWFDACYDQSPEALQATEMLKMMRTIQPDLIVNNRLGIPLDFDTPEQFIPGTGVPGRDWETCMTINDTWGFKKDDRNWKSTEVLLRNLIDIVSKGGNYLLNVGPTAEGEIPAECATRLEEIGRWMTVNGEAIHGTTASPFRRLAWGRCTQKPGRLYLHVFDWPKGELVVPGLKSKVEQAYLLADAGKAPLAVMRREGDVVVELPAPAPDKIASVVVLAIAGAVEVTPYAVPQAADGSVTLPAVDATIHGNTAAYESDPRKDCIGYWMNSHDWLGWDYLLKKPGAFDVEITLACVDAEAGSEYVVDVSGQKLTGKVEGTGAWDKFVTKKLGSVRIDAAGRQVLSVRATAMPHGAVMNLRAVVLRPVP